MSAYLVSDKHISAMLKAALSDPWASYYWQGERRRLEDWQDLGQKLLEENYRSLNYRYGDNGPAHQFKFQRVDRYEPVEIIRLCDGYSYQACESPDWKETEAHAIVQGIREAAIRNLPGYEQAPRTL